MLAIFTIVVVVLLVVLLALVFLNFTFLTVTFPELAVFLASMLIFFLLSRRLIFENAFIIGFLSKIANGEPIEAKQVIGKMRGHPDVFSGWTPLSILSYWKNTIDVYRYTFYSLFALLLLLALIARFTALQTPLIAVFLETAVMGALIPVYFVWAYDSLASYYLNNALEL
ncbi:MAG: hypothetical protein GXO48_07340 [Chlorobi bacterium]|nr:hypothetical protein [Chlorobiota bacterium]